MAKGDFLQALTRSENRTYVSGPGTSIVSIELMEYLNVYFPEAHLNAEKMAALAAAGHTIYGFDVVMPLFSVWHESAALGCPVNWGTKTVMPDCSVHIFASDEDVIIPPDFLEQPGCSIPLEAIRLLKKQLGDEAAVCGKVFGPWTLGYHVFGVENFLVNTLLEPDMIKRSMEKLTSVTLRFAQAQLDAGADCLLLGDHATRDLCSPEAYREFLMETHAELVERIDSPLILHICGDTSDRIGMIADTQIQCFHWDTKTGPPEKARTLAGERLSLMGGLNNTELLRKGTEEQIKTAIDQCIGAGIDIIAPECAVPLDTPMKNLKTAGMYVQELRRNDHRINMYEP
jgi:[methyl-Co(III) methanol-specific corrinoid protein]:coenzyme M methyltransferase